MKEKEAKEQQDREEWPEEEWDERWIDSTEEARENWREEDEEGQGYDSAADYYEDENPYDGWPGDDESYNEDDDEHGDEGGGEATRDMMKTVRVKMNMTKMTALMKMVTHMIKTMLRWIW